MKQYLDGRERPDFGAQRGATGGDHERTQRQIELAHLRHHPVPQEDPDCLEGGVFDVLLHNERGEITESSIANVAVQQPDGTWHTPPLEPPSSHEIGTCSAATDGRAGVAATQAPSL